MACRVYVNKKQNVALLNQLRENGSSFALKNSYNKSIFIINIYNTTTLINHVTM